MCSEICVTDAQTRDIISLIPSWKPHSASSTIKPRKGEGAFYPVPTTLNMFLDTEIVNLHLGEMMLTKCRSIHRTPVQPQVLRALMPPGYKPLGLSYEISHTCTELKAFLLVS
jgi:hypothetical protein